MIDKELMLEKRRCKVELCCFLFIYLIQLSGIYGASTTGQSFALAFIENRVLVDYPQPKVYISSMSDNEVTVNISVPRMSYQFPSEIYTLSPGESLEHIFDYAIHLLNPGYEDKGILIDATGDISIQAASVNERSSDGLLVYPIQGLGTEYFAMSYIFVGDSKYIQGPSEIAIVAVQEDTVIKIEVTDPDMEIEGTDFMYSPVYGTYELTMTKFEAFKMRSLSDLTGTRLFSNRPIAVFSGAVWTSVASQYMGDHLTEQMPPTNTWGTQFLTVPLATRNSGDVFRVVAKQDETLIRVIGNLDSDKETRAKINRKEHFEFVLSSTTYAQIVTTKPVLVAQFCKSFSADESKVSDPFMAIIPPVEQYTDSIHFATITISKRNTVEFEHFISITVPSKDSDSLLYDDLPLENPNWVEYKGGEYLGTTMAVTRGQHSLSFTEEEETSNRTLSALLYGYKEQEAYGLPLGFKMHDVSAACHPTPMSPMDNFDNDCDGLIDEEIIDGIDNDGDGRIDEDVFNDKIGRSNSGTHILSGDPNTGSIDNSHSHDDSNTKPSIMSTSNPDFKEMLTEDELLQVPASLLYTKSSASLQIVTTSSAGIDPSADALGAMDLINAGSGDGGSGGEGNVYGSNAWMYDSNGNLIHQKTDDLSGSRQNAIPASLLSSYNSDERLYSSQNQNAKSTASLDLEISSSVLSSDPYSTPASLLPNTNEPDMNIIPASLLSSFNSNLDGHGNKDIPLSLLINTKTLELSRTIDTVLLTSSPTGGVGLSMTTSSQLPSLSTNDISISTGSQIQNHNLNTASLGIISSSSGDISSSLENKHFKTDKLTGNWQTIITGNIDDTLGGKNLNRNTINPSRTMFDGASENVLSNDVDNSNSLFYDSKTLQIHTTSSSSISTDSMSLNYANSSINSNYSDVMTTGNFALVDSSDVTSAPLEGESADEQFLDYKIFVIPIGIVFGIPLLVIALVLLKTGCGGLKKNKNNQNKVQPSALSDKPKPKPAPKKEEKPPARAQNYVSQDAAAVIQTKNDKTFEDINKTKIPKKTTKASSNIEQGPGTPDSALGVGAGTNASALAQNETDIPKKKRSRSKSKEPNKKPKRKDRSKSKDPKSNSKPPSGKNLNNSSADKGGKSGNSDTRLSPSNSPTTSALNNSTSHLIQID